MESYEIKNFYNINIENKLMDRIENYLEDQDEQPHYL